MKPILAIILLSSVISNTDAGMGELTEELLYVAFFIRGSGTRLDENTRMTTYWMRTDENCVERCSISSVGSQPPNAKENEKIWFPSSSLSSECSHPT